jgi:hypothetical protein
MKYADTERLKKSNSYYYTAETTVPSTICTNNLDKIAKDSAFIDTNVQNVTWQSHIIP